MLVLLCQIRVALLKVFEYMFHSYVVVYYFSYYTVIMLVSMPYSSSFSDGFLIYVFMHY